MNVRLQTLGSGNIRTAFGQLRWKSRGYGRRVVDHGPDGYGEVGRDLADERGDCVLVLRAGNCNIDCLRASCLKLGLGLLHFHVGSNTSGKATLD